MVSSPLIRPYLLGGWPWGGYLRFPWYKPLFATGILGGGQHLTNTLQILHKLWRPEIHFGKPIFLLVSKVYLEVSKNRGLYPPNHPILIGFSFPLFINHPFWGVNPTPIFGWNTPLLKRCWTIGYVSCTPPRKKPWKKPTSRINPTHRNWRPQLVSSSRLARGWIEVRAAVQKPQLYRDSQTMKCWWVHRDPYWLAYSSTFHFGCQMVSLQGVNSRIP